MPGDVTTNVSAVVTVVDKTGAGLASINKNLASVEETVKAINTHVPTSLAEIAAQAPGNIWNLPVRGADVIPDILTPAQIQTVKVGGVFERLRDKIGEVAGSIKSRLGEAFEASWNVASKVVGRLTSAFTSFGGLFVAGFGIGTALDTLVGGMTELVNTVDKLKPQADALGITVGKLQDLTVWAQESGAPIDRVVSSLQNLTRVSAGVDQGAKGYDRAAAAFEKLQISVRDADTGKMKDVNALLPELAAGFQGIADPAERAKLAYDIFGQTWKLMLPLLMQGPEALEAAAKASEGIGRISDAQVEAAGKYKTALVDFQATTKGLREQIGAELLPVATPMLKDLTEFLQANKGEISGGFKLFVDGLIEGFKQLDAVVKSTADDINAIKGVWDWLQKPIQVPEWFGGNPANYKPAYGGGPLTPADLAPPIPYAPPPSGTVNVVIDNKNAPPGQTVAASATGTGVKVDTGQSMPWVVPDYQGPYQPARTF